MKIVFMLEERSMKEFLDRLLPSILPEGFDFQTIPHEGKSDLRKSIPIKLKAWCEPDVAFVIVHDQDSSNCMQLKQGLIDLCQPYNRKVLVRIPCHELESWYWGDLQALSKAYEKDFTGLEAKKGFRNPDSIVNPKQELKKIIPNLTQIDAARRIASHINLSNNRSKSFNVFIDGVKRLCKELKMSA